MGLTMKPPVPFAGTAFIRYHNLSGGPQCNLTMGVDFTSVGFSGTDCANVASAITTAVTGILNLFSADIFFDVVEVLAEDGSGAHGSASGAGQGTAVGTPVDPTQCKEVLNYPSSIHKLISRMYVPGQTTGDYSTNPSKWILAVAVNSINVYNTIASAIASLAPVQPAIVSHAWLMTVPISTSATYIKDLGINHQTRRANT